MISRRQIIKTGIAFLALPKFMAMAKIEKFRNSFAVPKLETGKRVGKNVYFDLRIQAGTSAILPNKKTPTLGINQPFLGVTLRANKGDTVRINVKNNLRKTTTLHWHGMKLPAKADGGPHQPIAPKATWRTQFDIIQDASTLWYHSHQLHKTGEQVYEGLAGMFIIDDAAANALNLPSEYGVDDFPVIIQDKTFNDDGSFSYLNSMPDRMMGKKGDVVLVNGVHKPVLKTKKSLLRLRLTNGSNARVYHLNFDDRRSFDIIAGDGGLLEKPVKANRLVLAPAERVEIMVDVADGAMPVLQHNEPKGGRSMGMMHGGKDRFDIFQIDAGQAQKTKITVPKKLVAHKQFARADKTRTFELQMKMGMMGMFGDAFSINGKAMDMDRIDEVVKAGDVEVWRIKNSSVMAHPFHIHNVQFKIISRDGGVKGHELSFKDVVLVHPNETVEVIMQFPNFSDKKTPYMYHCHILEHEDRGMMGQFVVV